jgi:hypothetical protein
LLLDDFLAALVDLAGFAFLTTAFLMVIVFFSFLAATFFFFPSLA